MPKYFVDTLALIFSGIFAILIDLYCGLLAAVIENAIYVVFLTFRESFTCTRSLLIIFSSISTRFLTSFHVFP